MKTNGMHLYQQIQDYIMGMISRQELKPGDRLPSEHDLSEKMKVSRLTVRKAYVPLIEKGILSASQGKGTFVSDLSSYSLQELSKYSGKGLHSKKVVSVIFPEITVFFAPIIKVIEEVATKNNFTLNVMFNDSYDRELNAINTTIANKVDGVIITPIRNALRSSIDNYKKLLDSNIPIVMIGKPPFEIECDCVMCDDILGAFTAVSHFIDNGHTSIIHVFDSGDDAEALVERQEGYRRAIVKRLPNMTYLEVDIAYSGWESKIMDYITEYKVTAVFSDTDTAAAQVHFLRNINPSVFPDNFSIIAYSTSTIFDIFNIKIPSVDIPREQMGRKAIEHLKNKILSAPSADSNSCQQHYIFKPKLEGID